MFTKPSLACTIATTKECTVSSAHGTTSHAGARGVILTLVTALLFVSVNAVAGNSKVKLSYVQSQLRTEQDLNADGVVAYQTTTRYKGGPGRAESMGLTEVIEAPGGGFFPGDEYGCPAEFPFALPFDIIEDAIVFQDLSTLLLSRTDGDAVACFGFSQVGELTGFSFYDVEVTGGTGRFEGATGTLHFEADLVRGFFLEYAVQKGTVTGIVQTP